MCTLVTGGRGCCLIIQGITLPCVSILEVRDLKVCVYPRHQWEGLLPYYSRNNSALRVHIGSPRPQGVCVPSSPVGGACCLIIQGITLPCVSTLGVRDLKVCVYPRHQWEGLLPYYSRNNSALHAHIGSPRPQGVCVPSSPVGGTCCLIIQGITLPCVSTLGVRDLKVCVYPRHQWEGPVALLFKE